MTEPCSDIATRGSRSAGILGGRLKLQSFDTRSDPRVTTD